MLNEKDNTNSADAPVGTLDMLRRLGNRRKSQSVTLEPVEADNAIIERGVSDIINLDDATEFIRKNDREVTQGWFNLAHAFKKVRDERLYEEKYETFQEYFTNELGYSKRMVYYFINLAENYPLGTSDELIKLGVKKLIEMSELTEEERIEYVNNNDVSEKSAAEIRKDIKSMKSEKNDNIKEKNSIPDDEVSAGDKNSNVNSHVDTGRELNISGLEAEISISPTELKLLSKYHKKVRDYFELIESFKADQENSLPVNKTKLEEIKTHIEKFTDENAKLISLIRKYTE